MNANKIMIAGIIAGLSAIVIGVYAFYKRQIYLVMQYCYKLYKIDLKSFTKDSIQMTIWLKILNRSTFQLMIKSYSLDVSINDNYILTAKNDQDIPINPKSTSFIQVNVDMKPGNVLKGSFLLEMIKDYLLDKSKIIIHVKGTLSAQANFIITNLPIDYQNNLKDLTSTSTPDPSTQEAITESENLTCPKNF